MLNPDMAYLNDNYLKLKAGLPSDYWSPTLTVSRYTTEYFTKEAS